MNELLPASFSAIPIALLGIGLLTLAYVASALMQPVVRRIAVHKGLLDLPDGERRLHSGPIPRLGGIGVFVAMLVAVGVGASLEPRAHLLYLLPFILSVAIGATMLFAVGLVDDLRGVRPAMKILVQSIAATIVWYFGLQIYYVALPGGHVIALGWLSLPVIILWIVGLSNAFNLVDGADGLAGGVAIIALAATAISALVLRNTVVFWASVALTGAMLGFLRYNLPPARIFLGDSGSLVVGFLLAVLTVKGMSASNGTVFAFGPIFALSYPLLDTGVSMMRRWLRGEPFSRADGRHIHHQLRKLGMGPRQSLGLLLTLSALVAALGLSISIAPVQFTMALALAGAVLLLALLVYGARWLQYTELLEAGASLTSAVVTGRVRLQDRIYAQDIARLILYARSLDDLRAVIDDNISTFRFAHMQLRWGLTDETPPANIIVDMLDARLWSYDYPILSRCGTTPPLFLSVWCEVEGGHQSAGVERVTRILAPAVARWLSEHPDAVPEAMSGWRDPARLTLARAVHEDAGGMRRRSGHGDSSVAEHTPQLLG